MKIFIGCSMTHLVGKDATEISEENCKKENSLAYKISESYAKDSNIEIKAWWDNETIEQGADFFRRVVELSSICDFGIFILGQEHREERREGEHKSYDYLSNDNVYIELGMFIANKGIENTLFILEDGVKRPSDFSGLKADCFDFEKYSEFILKYVDSRIKKGIIKSKNYVDFKLFINKRTNDKIFESKPVTKNWRSKSAYIGLDSAKTWYNIETNAEYMSGKFKSSFQKFISNKVKNEIGKIHNIVSLGSGIGSIDKIIVRNIEYEGVKYIPIEINPYLAYKALDNVLNATLNNHNSFAIIDDFEEDISQLNDFLTNTLIKKEEQSLYIMLGGTFCNIESQSTFLREFSQLIDDKGDYFLFDASVIGEDYDRQRDEEKRLRNKFAKDLLINAIEFKYQTNELYHSNKRVKDFLKYSHKKQVADIFEKKFVTIDYYGDASKNENVTFLYRFCLDDNNKNPTTESSILFKIKRYQNDLLVKKISEHFDIVKFGDKSYEQIGLSEDIGMSYFLLKKK